MQLQNAHLNHPVNQDPPPRANKAYASLAQDDDSAPAPSQSNLPVLHYHGIDDPEAQQQGQASSTANAAEGENAVPLQPSNVTFNVNQPHVHCEECDRMTMRRDKHRKEMECCRTAGISIVMAIVCLMILGIIIVIHK